MAPQFLINERKFREEEKGKRLEGKELGGILGTTNSEVRTVVV
jgi:hypothetical protein